MAQFVTAAHTRKIARSRNALFIGCGTNYPLALEGALKLKEITDIHAEGYPAGELKHGPIAFIDRNLPVVVIAPSDITFENTMSNMQEVIARGGRTILITDHRGASVATECWEVLALPDMSSLVAPLVFALPLQLLAEGVLDGLRIDHVDGLLNPKEYFQRLRAHDSSGNPFYLVVEKILQRHESLRDDWPVDGTTGYEFANLALGLLIDPAGAEPFTRIYVEWTGERRSFHEIVRECKLRIMKNEMAGELDVLARHAARVAHQNPCTADFTVNVLRRAMREVLACFPVYRIFFYY